MCVYCEADPEERRTTLSSIEADVNKIKKSIKVHFFLLEKLSDAVTSQRDILNLILYNAKETDSE